MWSRDEEIVLLDFYFSSPENTHTDSHADCRALARQLGRSASAVDMRLRNVRSLLENRGLPHIPPNIQHILREFAHNHTRIRQEADRIRRRHQWRRIG